MRWKWFIVSLRLWRLLRFCENSNCFDTCIDNALLNLLALVRQVFVVHGMKVLTIICYNLNHFIPIFQLYKIIILVQYFVWQFILIQ